MSYDYVIVGSGPSAIGVLYGLLESFGGTPSWSTTTTVDHSDSDDTKHDAKTTPRRTPPFSVAIVERGCGPPHDVSTRHPHRWYEAAHKMPDSGSVRHYRSNITGRVLDLPVGQGLGGSSNINACLCTPPLPHDFKAWPEPWKSKVLSKARYLQQRLQQNGALLHGAGRSSSSSSRPLLGPFRDKTPGLDLSTPVPTLVSFVDDDGKADYVRENYYSGLLEPLLTNAPHLKGQLHWLRGCEVQRLLLDDLDSKRVVGVEYSSALNCQETRELYANKRIVLCAGAIESPALLLVSKLGGEHDPLLSGVGKRLQDQAILPRTYLTCPNLRNVVFGPWREAQPNIQQSTSGIAALGHLYLQGREREGLNNGNCFQVAVTDSVPHAYILPTVLATAFRWECSSNIGTRFFEITFQLIKTLLRTLLLYTPLGIIVRHFTVTTLLSLLHPYSYGSVTISIRKTDCVGRGEPTRRRDVTVMADPGYLNDPRDFRAFKEAWDATGNLTCYPTLEVSPQLVFAFLKLFGPNDYWFQSYSRSFLLPYYHFVGTCAMQSSSESCPDNPEWVVDSSALKLRGYVGLSVCDASVFPTTLSNPPALTCASLGYVFGQMLLVEDEASR